MAKKKIKIKWLLEPEEHDYPAAQSYLSLIYDESITTGYRNLKRKIFLERLVCPY